jgi:hypothetical protein
LQGAAHILTKIYPICLRILAEFQELIVAVTEGYKNGHLKDLALMQNKSTSNTQVWAIAGLRTAIA